DAPMGRIGRTVTFVHADQEGGMTPQIVKIGGTFRSMAAEGFAYLQLLSQIWIKMVAWKSARKMGT
ncbi:hypothetical protein Droror1_Dr00002363, partial [Drosera rotundifolia]